MYKKIMVAIDGSDAAQQALEEAVNIANTYNATLRIVHCVSGDTEVDRGAGLQILERAKSNFDAVSIETRLLKAEAEYGLTGIVEAIDAAASEWGADLLAVGTSHRQGLERFYIGSVAEQLVNKVNASVLLVRPKKG
ncbi:universal stress protein [Nitrosomonas communis]|uniref:Nucleotide-binding universal stress protein, UspA family n=1 Tax=Nitrosomonas communis TaxID=44574 RepID=A0A1I4KEM6_9PROT|nr:universal stress protein [Nitrosomonas communis]SFL77119.1 Nucleotide-binding universal stress protein, UspA family [Nitrosomonas communis]